MTQLQQLFESTVLSNSSSPVKSLDAALQRIFSSPQEESRLQKARRIMGANVDAVADEDLETYLTELQYLIDEWLDAYERSVYDGYTLKVLIQD